MARRSRRGAGSSRKARTAEALRELAAADEPTRLGGSGADTVEEHADGDWVVRRLAGSASGRTYTCPGCGQLVAAGTPHVVVWPADRPLLGGEAVDARRHWHAACWQRRRGRRRPLA